MRLLCWEQAMCERKATKDAPAAVIFRAACLSRALPVDASRQALSGWGRSTWSFHVNLLSTTHIVFFFFNLLRVFIKGGPEPLEKESHEFLGSKRDDRFSNPFF